MSGVRCQEKELSSDILGTSMRKTAEYENENENDRESQSKFVLVLVLVLVLEEPWFSTRI